MPLGVTTATFPDEEGVIRTVEVEECGQRTLQPVTFLVPLELDCHQDDDIIRQRPSDDDDNDDDGVYNGASSVDSNSEADVTAGDWGRSFLPDMPSQESTYRTSGSTRAGRLTDGTTTRCNTDVASPSPTPPSLLPYNLVHTQTSRGEERDAGRGEVSTNEWQPRRAALVQKNSSSVFYNMIYRKPTCLPFEFVKENRSVGHSGEFKRL